MRYWICECECVNTDANVAYLALQDPRLLNDQRKQTSKQGCCMCCMCCCKDEGCTHTHTRTGWASGDGHRQRGQRDCRTADQLKKGEGRQEKTENRQHKKRKPNKAIEQSGSLGRTCHKTDERMSRQTNESKSKSNREDGQERGLSKSSWRLIHIYFWHLRACLKAPQARGRARECTRGKAEASRQIIVPNPF